MTNYHVMIKFSILALVEYNDISIFPQWIFLQGKKSKGSFQNSDKIKVETVIKLVCGLHAI